MQIVRELAGYTLGRSDLVRRAMSKKKASVMAKERQNFVYGNVEEGVPGCIANGISEEIANKIYDEMTDFAKYAFNKSHAAAYAVVSYQTAGRIYGCTDDIRCGNAEQGCRVYFCMPPDGDPDPSAGYQSWCLWLFC